LTLVASEVLWFQDVAYTLKYGMWVRYGSAEVAQRLKFTYRGIRLEF